MSQKSPWVRALRYSILVLVLFVWIIPVIWVGVTSIKPRGAIFTMPPTLFFQPTLEHYVEALQTFGIAHSIVSSTILTMITVAATLVIAVPAGYAYARLRFRGRRTLSFYTLFTQMAPPIGILIPYFFVIGRLGLLDEYYTIIFVYLTITIPISTWLMITYFEDLPREIEEQAAIDGASRFTVFFRIALPQVRGGIVVVAILSFIEAWNQFLYPSVLAGSTVRPVPVAIFAFLTTEETLWGPFTATGVMIMAPVILMALLAQRQLVRGLTFGGIE